MINQKNSVLVTGQLPEFVRDNPDYENFNLFVKAYYEWLESANVANSSIETTQEVYDQGVAYAGKNLLSYKDIDSTIDGFTDYYVNDFLPYFPKDIIIDKAEAVKFARQLYQTKGTLASYKFLFKVLYNSDFDIFNTKDAVLKASDGQWYVAKSLKLATVNENFLNIKNLRIFGETTKSIGTIEASVLTGNKTEVFISNLERLFQSGEFVRIVDSDNQDVFFKNGEIVDSTTNGAEKLRAKIVGQISTISIDKDNRGKYYEPGDPVIVYGGLTSNTDIGATAVVGQTKAGSIQRINVLAGGFGYSYFPNTLITFSTPTNGANATVASFDTRGIANVSMIPIDTISFKKDIRLDSANYAFTNLVTANANTRLVDAFSFTSLTTYPITSVYVNYGGSGIRFAPEVQALGGYSSDLITYGANNANTPLLSSLGILAPIQIASGGVGYQNNDTIIFTGGSGRGAYANVSVNSTGSIVSAYYVNDTRRRFPVGGMGYRTLDLPSLSVNSANANSSGASLFVTGILGEGAVLSAVTDNAGEIVNIKIIDYGEDYISTPQVSLRVQDIVVANVELTNLPQKGDTIIQGANIAVATYIATVNSVNLLVGNADPKQSLWNLRVFNYNSAPDPVKSLSVVEKSISVNMANTAYAANTFYVGSPKYDVNGVKSYGDGTAKGSSKFLNGLVISEGQYLDSRGQPSSFSVLQDDVYNNYTYQITVQKEINKYRNVLLELLHPTGMRLIGRYALKSNSNMYFHGTQASFSGESMYYYTGTGAYVTMETNFTNKSNNVIKFYLPNTIPPTQLSDFLEANVSTIKLYPTNGYNISAKVISFNNTTNTAILDTNTWLTFANVASVTAIANSNVINITALTGQYDIINNRNYSNVDYPLKDIVHTGDKVLVGNNTSKTVQTVDYVNGIIYLTTNLTANANSYLSVNRTFIANTTLNSDQVKIYGPLGPQYRPFLTTEDGVLISTENGEILFLG